MVRPVHPSAPATSTPIEPFIVNPLYKDRFGISTLTQAAPSRKSIIILGVLAVGTVLLYLWRRMPSLENFLIALWRKLFPAEPIPTAIQDWVNQNCSDLNANHQQAVAISIIRVKRKMDRTINPNVGEIFNSTIALDLRCDQCTKIKTYVLRYFDAHPLAPPVSTLSSPYNEEIRKWILFRDKDTPEEVLVQVVQRVLEIEKLPACSQNPKALIRRLRTESIRSTNIDPIQAKAVSFLTFKYKVLGK